MQGLARDVQLAVRGFRRRPGFTIVVALTLGLGIGATTAVFSVVDAVLLRPLPYAAPDRLVVVVAELPQVGRLRAHVSGPELAALWDGARSLETIGAVWARPGVLRGGDGPVDEIEVGWLTPGFLEALGVRPHIGRLPTRAEHATEKPEVMVLSFELWRNRYGGDPGILGRTIEFDDQRWTVVGVMPPGFRMLFPPEEGVPEELGAWLPWGGNAYAEMTRSFRVFTTVARLRPGVSRHQAGEEIRALAERVRESSTEYQASGFGLRLEPLAEGVAAHVRPTLLVLSGVVAFVLLIASANVANLTLARADEAERDLAVRAALGASPRRLRRQILTESALMGALGAGVGVLLAGWGLQLLRVFEPGRLPRIHDVALDARAMAAAGGAALLAALLSGGIAAARSLRGAGVASLHVGTRGAGAPPQLFRRLLVVSQLALSLVLLAGAGLLLRSAVRLHGVDPGFRPQGLLTLRLSLPDVHYSARLEDLCS